MSSENSVPRKSYHRVFRERIEDHWDKDAIVYRGERISYGRLWKDAVALASGLRGRGLEKGDRLGVAMYTRPEWALSLLACSIGGLVLTPVNPSHKPREIQEQLSDARARGLLYGQSVYETVEVLREDPSTLDRFVDADEEGPGDLTMEELLEEGRRAPTPDPDIDPEEDLLGLVYSSGTTGPPKGVMLTHTNLVASQLQYVRSGHVSEDDVSLIFLPAAHSYGLLLLGGGLMGRVTLVLMRRFRARGTLERTERYGVTLFYAIPSVVKELARLPDLEKYDLSTVRYINSGGAPLPEEPAERLEERTDVPVVGGYGLTEAPISGSRVPEEERRIVDLETGTETLPPGEIGELVIRGPHIMKGYWEDEEATREVLRDGWLYTGDIGYMDEEGHLKIVDRKKDMIKYKGFAVAPAELENVLLEHPDVRDCGVAGKPDETAGEIPVAWVVLRPGSIVSKEDLKEFVAESVAGYKRIREVRFTQKLPRNDFGKILKQEIREREMAGEPV